PAVHLPPGDRRAGFRSPRVPTTATRSGSAAMSLLSRLFARRAVSRRAPARSNRAALGLEQFEARVVPAVVATLAGTEVTIQGSSSGDRIDVSEYTAAVWVNGQLIF